MFIIWEAIKGPIPTPRLALAPRYPIFFGISGGFVISVIKEINTGLIKPNPIPPNIFAITYNSKDIDRVAMTIAIPNKIKPVNNTGNLPFISEIAPEKS